MNKEKYDLCESTLDFTEVGACVTFLYLSLISANQSAVPTLGADFLDTAE